jgi:hypothetical protein
MWVKDDTGGTYWDGHDEFRHMVERARDGARRALRRLDVLVHSVGRG